MAYAIRKPPTAFSSDKSGKATASFKDERHLAFIRTLPCVITGKLGCEACHIRTGSAEYNKKHTGKSQKPSDSWTVPMRPELHREQHSMNEADFWKLYGINPFRLASRLYEVTGDTEAALRVIETERKTAPKGDVQEG